MPRRVAQGDLAIATGGAWEHDKRRRRPAKDVGGGIAARARGTAAGVRGECRGNGARRRLWGGLARRGRLWRARYDSAKRWWPTAQTDEGEQELGRRLAMVEGIT